LYIAILAIPISILAGYLGDKLMSHIKGEANDFHSLATTEMVPPLTKMSAAGEIGGSSNPSSTTTMNITSQPNAMGASGSSASLQVADVQATASATVTQILSDPVLVSTFNITNTTTVGTVVYSTPISPRMINATAETRVGYLSRMYRYWRGDFDFHFVFTKTILIQTKLMAVFVPGATATSPPPTKAQSTYFKHNVLMNPANEESYHLRVPFVSTTPFNEMSESTGMLYVITFEPLVISVGDTNAIPVSIFMSGLNLDFHEYDLLPDLDNNVIPYVDPEYSYIYLAAANVSPITIIAGTGTVNFSSDNGTLLSAAIGNTAVSYPFTPTQRVPIWAQYYVYTGGSPYSSSTCFTLAGSPVFGEVALYSRGVYCNAVVGAGTTVFGLAVSVSSSGSLWVSVITPVITSGAYQYQVLMSANLWELPLNYSSLLSLEQTESLFSRISFLEKALKA